MLTKIEDFTSHFRFIEVKKSDVSNAVPLIDLSLNKSYRGQLKGLKGVQTFQSHLRLTALTFEFWHDGISLPRAALPEIDELMPAFQQELVLREWLLTCPKRVAEVRLRGLPLREPSQFTYTEKGLINEVDFMQLLGDKASLIVDDSLSVAVLGGLKGDEKMRCYVAWDEYFSLLIR